MTTVRPFQIALIGGFAILGVISLIFLSVYKNSSSSGVDANPYGDKVVIWGTLSYNAFSAVLNEVAKDDKNLQVVQYVQKNAETFDYDLLSAIAEGNSPDLIVLPSDSLVTYREKLLAISYDTVSERTFRDSYVDGSEIFLLSDGVYAIPFAVDPLMMYWNRDIFSSNGLATPPSTWEELVNRVEPLLTQTSSSFTIAQSTVAFGEYNNVKNAKNILSLLFLQAGTTIVDEANYGYTITLSTNTTGTSPANAALSFFTQFALPSNPAYTWNRSLSQDRLQFLGGDLALYFGLGSEYGGIVNSNPNLNFDLAQVPQGANVTSKRGFGIFYGFAIPRSSANPDGAFAAAQRLASAGIAGPLSKELSLAPASRIVIAGGSSDPYLQTLYTAALVARAWLDPSPAKTENIFKLMIEDVTSGRVRVNEAAEDAVSRLKQLF